MKSNVASSLFDQLSSYWKALKEFFYGMTVHEMDMGSRRRKMI